MANEDTKNTQEEGAATQVTLAAPVATGPDGDDDGWGDGGDDAPGSSTPAGGVDDFETIPSPPGEVAGGPVITTSADDEPGETFDDPPDDDDGAVFTDVTTEDADDADEAAEGIPHKASKAKVYGLMGAGLVTLAGMVGGTLYWQNSMHTRSVHRLKPVAMAQATSLPTKEQPVSTEKSGAAQPAAKPAMTLNDIDAKLAQAAAAKDAKASDQPSAAPPVTLAPSLSVTQASAKEVSARAPGEVAPSVQPSQSVAAGVQGGGIQPNTGSALVSPASAQQAEALATRARDAETKTKLDALAQADLKQQDSVTKLTTRVQALEERLDKIEEQQRAAQAAKDAAEKQAAEAAQAAQDAARVEQQKKAFAEQQAKDAAKAKAEARRKRHHRDAEINPEPKPVAAAKPEVRGAAARTEPTVRHEPRRVANAGSTRLEPPAMPKVTPHSAGVSAFKVVATYPVTQQPGMLPEKAWITDGESLVQVKVGSSVAGAQVTRIEGTTVFTTRGTITSQRP